MVTQYTPECGYYHLKLKKKIILLNKGYAKNISIDNGAAYINNVIATPLALEGSNISLEEKETFNERYKFEKTVTFSLKGKVDLNNLEERYYLIVQSTDETYWLVNPDYPCKVTYTYNIQNGVNQTDFTFHLLSNFPILKVDSTLPEPNRYCDYYYPIIDSFYLIENNFVSLDRKEGVLYNYSLHAFKKIDYLGTSLSLQETFDGNKKTTTISFDIAFDGYIPSFQYNLLEFKDNLYCSKIYMKDGNVVYSGFENGLFPSYSVKSSSNNGESDVVTITLTETSINGSELSTGVTESADTSTTWNNVETVGEYDGFICVGKGLAQYILREERDGKGNPTGNYKAFEGYSEEFPNINIVGTFNELVYFNTNKCVGDLCSLTTNIPDTVIYQGTGTRAYYINSDCDWEIQDIPDFMTISPTTGSGGVNTSIAMICNVSVITAGTISIHYDDRILFKNIKVYPDYSWIFPSIKRINCLKQDVIFLFNTKCIEVTDSAGLEYDLTTNFLIFHVPFNDDVNNQITYEIEVNDCNGNQVTLAIIQDKLYESWTIDDSNEYMCESGSSYHVLHRYTGTSETTMVATNVTKKGSLIQANDNRCVDRRTRWRASQEYYCIDGDKYEANLEEETYDNENWYKTGASSIGDEIESESDDCGSGSTVTYTWVLTNESICDSN